MVCTPHLPDYDEILVSRVREVIDEVRAAVTDAGVDLTLLLGFEVDASVAAFADDEVLRSLTVEDSPGVIVLEMPYAGWPVYMDQAIFRLSTSGYKPVLAHPERNDLLQKSSEHLVTCIRAGAVGQATAASLSGEFGRGPAQTLRRLLAEGLISLVASDAHAFRREGWTMVPMLDALADMVDEGARALLSDTNPGHLLAGEPLLPVSTGDPDTGWSRRLRRRRQ